jgi:hypothetical protein
MKASRVRLAERIAAVEAFREEGERQRLATARNASMKAESAAATAKQAWLDAETARAEALAVRRDVAQYLTWTEVAGELRERHEDARLHAEAMRAEADDRSTVWATAKARADATEDRAARMAREAFAMIESLQGAERLELWLNARGHKS